MKQIWKDLGLAVLLGMVLPGVILHLGTKFQKNQQLQLQAEEISPETILNSPEETRISVQNREGTAEDMVLTDYLVGVLLAEMPASFETEALKAQAVVARTYTLRAKEKGKHDDALVCMESSCCQGYCEPEAYLKKGGTEESIRKIRRAVEDTSEYVLCYNGELIEATYFSCSGGRTEDAVAVWGTEVTYLQAVDSPGEEEAAHYEDEQVFTVSEICSKLNLEQADGTLFGKATYTAGGGVDSIEVSGKTIGGTELRKLLNLRSTAFTVTEEEGSVTFHTRGFGHRVGMSQYGADAMAGRGCTFAEILAHYYPGTELRKMSD